MSELKTFDSQRIYWAVEQVERVAGDIAEVHLDDNLFYLKSEVDKLIETLKSEIEEQKRLRDMALASVPNVLKVMKIIQHHKYKRCLAMANWCFTRSNFFFVVGRSEGGRFAEERFRRSNLYLKWCDRWQRLAETFNPNKPKLKGE